MSDLVIHTHDLPDLTVAQLVSLPPARLQELEVSRSNSSSPMAVPTRKRAVSISPIAPSMPPPVPSALLERRPDVRQAETQLVAANARVGEAKALFFPSISLTAILGGVSTHLSEAVRGQAAVASLGPSLLQPLYAGGRLVFNRDAALARLDQALINYRKSVLNALAEVANSIEAYETGAELMEIQQRRSHASREALRLAELRFRAGTTSFLEVLDAQQRTHLAAETEAAQSLLERRQAYIRLYLALGGGWENVEPREGPQ